MRLIAILAFTFLALIPLAHAQTRGQCGAEGVWIQILGSGGAELNDGRAAASYLVWIDGKARLLVDTAPGSSFAFDLVSARFEDLDAIVYTQLHADHASEFPAFVDGSRFVDRTRDLTVLGPTGNETTPSMTAFVDAMIGTQGVFRYLHDFLTYDPGGRYQIFARDVPAEGQRRWAQFASPTLRLAAIPVDHGDVPALAWRVNVGAQSITFSGDFSNQKNTLVKLAQRSDALVAHASILETTRGRRRESYARPSQIGRIAHDAHVRMLILGHRTRTTRGNESAVAAAIEATYKGPVLFGDDLDCWGL